jgi:hypothetical protein
MTCSFDLPRPPPQLQHQAAIREMPTQQLEGLRRQLDAPFEMTVRYLHAQNPGSLHLARQGALTAHDEDASAQYDIDVFELDAGEGDQDSQPVTGFEHVDRRLPMRTRVMKKLPMQSLGSLHCGAGLRPHLCFELTRWHTYSPRR